MSTVTDEAIGTAGRSAGSSRPLVEMRGIVKEFPGVVAVNNVDLDIHAGEILSLTGENGSGKSTLSKILGGVEQADRGIIRVDGEERRIGNPLAALELGIVLISQELTLAPTLTVAENILLGRLPVKRGLVDWPKAHEEARKVLGQLDVHLDTRTIVKDLSIELQQEVEIARAVSTNARVLILDEATSSLSEKATERLLSIVRELAASGVAVVMITHRMPEIYSSAQRAVVLRDGALVGSASIPETSESRLVTMMVGRELGDYYGARSATIGEIALEISDLQTDDGQLQPVSLNVRSGEIVGVAGLVGSGKGHFAQALGGVIPAAGSVNVQGRRVRLGAPQAAIQAGIGYVPDDRRRAALLPERSVAENLSLAWYFLLSKLGFIQLRSERDQVADAISKYQIKTSSTAKSIKLLSGGNQQKAILGRTFLRDSPVYVLNEPTRGVDVGSKSTIYGFLQEMAESGAAIVVVSSELPELIGLSDRIAVFFHGSIRAVVSGDEMNEEVIAALSVSGRFPDR